MTFLWITLENAVSICMLRFLRLKCDRYVWTSWIIYRFTSQKAWRCFHSSATWFSYQSPPSTAGTLSSRSTTGPSVTSRLWPAWSSWSTNPEAGTGLQVARTWLQTSSYLRDTRSNSWLSQLRLPETTTLI